MEQTRSSNNNIKFCSGPKYLHFLREFWTSRYQRI